MDYPIDILPNPNYKLIECDISDFFLVRHIDIVDISKLWDEVTNTLNISCICAPSERIDDLSMSLLSVFKIENIHIKLTEQGNTKYNERCNPDDSIETPIFNVDYIINEQRHFWCTPLKYLHNEIFDFSASNQPLIAKCIVSHTPMKWNYWHFSLDWDVYGTRMSSLERNHRKNLARKIGHSVRTTIAKFASIINPPIQKLDSACYCKN